MANKYILSGTQLEHYEYEKIPKGKQYRSKARKNRLSEAERISFIRRSDNIKRLRKDFVRLIRANLVRAQPPALLTLTVVDSVSFETSVVWFNVFAKRLRRKFSTRELVYIAVPEWQQRGAIHYHVLIWGLPDETIKKERDTRCLQSLWLRGFVDCVATDGHPKIAAYLGKYMQKALHDKRLLGKRAYNASRNVMRPLSTRSYATVDAVMTHEGYIQDEKPLQILEMDTVWCGRIIYKRFNLRELHGS